MHDWTKNCYTKPASNLGESGKMNEVKVLHTSRLNQDCVENLFSVI